jgi:hypothetical protein
VFAKEQAPTLKVFGTELGTKWYDATSFVTPHDYFFVHSPYPTPRVNPETWRLGVSGDAVAQPMEFTDEDLLAWRGYAPTWRRFEPRSSRRGSSPGLPPSRTT